MTAAAALLALAAPVEPQVMLVRLRPNGRCEVKIGEQVFDPEREGDAVERAVASLPDKAAVRLRGDAKIPFRCVGGLIYAMQRHGVGPIAYVSEPSQPSK